ncbi:MAG TPA: response regulator transcription factor [Bacteroidales bacterium]|nr:response regulator transcription factor [Bacteroidales bacterium]HPD24449.1 response regulator transcription factor [Bacteroidales bacterium]HRS98734.1 response regulator transcription factor [Bacteroidales bacterium]HRT79322.1 response regulator transcription factor [Bacteroidales bacterium]
MDKNYKAKILLADDDPDILEFLSYNLKKENYRVYSAENGEEAIEKSLKHKPDLILLDVMMPKKNGMDVCKELRENPKLDDVIICLLTARNEDYSQIIGFESGADDYVAKPIKSTVLIKRIEALLKRKIKRDDLENKIFISGDIKIDFESRKVYVGKKEISLPKKEFKLLKLLVSQPGKVFTREEIYSKVWGNDVIVGDRTIDVHIKKLREKIGNNYITTIKAVGYKFNLE